MIRYLLTMIVFMTFIINPAQSKEKLPTDRTGKKGIGIIVSDINGDLQFKYWLTRYLCLQPVVGMSIISPDEGDTGINYRLGLGILGYNIKRLSSYYGIRGAISVLTNGEESYQDIGVAFVYGVEYFISEQFSFGGEFQFSVWAADEDFSPGGFNFGSTNYSTVQLASFNFYFK